MASHTPNASRRNMLGILAAAPALIGTAAAAAHATPASEWDRARARYEAARRLAYGRNAEEHVQELTAAADALIETQAPTVAALAYKIQVVIVEYEGSVVPDSVLQLLKLDASALASEKGLAS